ncbi:MAG: DUF3179 domain-containing protein [Planctomycetes bacterium]|nr:DUF3179 domain-containing protein [Planctomycetota bacterium]
MQKMYEDYRDLVEFRLVYIREAHAADSDWAVGYAKDLGLLEHKNYGQRCAAAEKLFKDEKLTIPCLIDGMDNVANEAYKAHPDRIFLIRKDGTLGVAGKRGPFGFVPALNQAQAWLAEYRSTGKEPDLSFAQQYAEANPEPERSWGQRGTRQRGARQRGARQRGGRDRGARQRDERDGGRRNRGGLNLWSSDDDQREAEEQPARPSRKLLSNVAAIIGEWYMKTEFSGQMIDATMTISEENGALTGAWVSMGHEMELSGLEFDGRKLSFKRSIGPGQDMTYEGTVRGDKITGRYNGPFGELNSNGERLPEGSRSGVVEATPVVPPDANAPADPPRGGRVPRQRGSDPGMNTKAAGGSLLDGRERSFVVVGYSTSFAWPTMLQDMLNEHSQGRQIYHVLNAVVGGSPVNPWITTQGSEPYERTFGAMLRDYFGPNARLRAGAPAPTVALCQQSLQFTRSRLGPIASIDDAEGIRIGADALETLATRLHDQGIERIYVATHIYKQGYEPQVGNERFALKKLLSRGHDFISEGPDVWSLTVGEHPDAFTEDGIHPNERGMKIMAEAWYRVLAGADARQDTIDRMHRRTYDVGKMARDYVASRRNDPKHTPKITKKEQQPAQPEMSARERATLIENMTAELIQVSGKGDRDQALSMALKILEEAQKLQEQGSPDAGSFLSLTHYNTACMYSVLRQKDEAFDHLFEAIKFGGFGGRDLADTIEGDKDFDNIRNDRRFEDALKQAKRGSGGTSAGGGDSDGFRGVLGADSDKIKKIGDRTLLWASGDRESDGAKWYDFTGAPMPAEDLQFGIGQDAIKAIDDPVFVDPDDPRLLRIPTSTYRPEEEPKTNDEIMVIGYVYGDDARAYPVALLDDHELVNDMVGGKPVTVGW